MPDQEIQNAVIRHARSDMARVPDASQLHPEAEYSGAAELGKAILKTVFQGAGEAIDRLIPHGASELANALYYGSAFYPFGAVSNHAPTAPEEPQAGNPAAGLDYDSLLTDAARGAGHGRDQGISR